MYVIVAGAGTVGYHLTKELLGAGHEVALFERDPRRAGEVAEELGSLVVPHPADEGRWLIEAGVERADVVVAATGDDEDNLVICQLAALVARRRGARAPRTIARVNHPKNESVLRRLGVDATVNLTGLMLPVIEEELSSHPTVHLLTMRRAGVELMEITIPAGSPAAGRTVAELGLPDGASLATVVRGGEALVAEPGTTIQPDDAVIVLLPISRESELRAALVGA